MWLCCLYIYLSFSFPSFQYETYPLEENGRTGGGTAYVLLLLLLGGVGLQPAKRQRGQSGHRRHQKENKAESAAHAARVQTDEEGPDLTEAKGPGAPDVRVLHPRRGGRPRHGLFPVPPLRPDAAQGDHDNRVPGNRRRCGGCARKEAGRR